MRLTPVLSLVLATHALAVESVHFGVSLANAPMTDAIRLSARTGTNWWSLNSTQLNPENGAAIPYAYHDGYVEWVGTSKTAVAVSTGLQTMLRGGVGNYTWAPGTGSWNLVPTEIQQLN